MSNKKKSNRDINVMILAGNGFDISILNNYRKDRRITSYEEFYNYVIDTKRFKETNILLKQMKVDKINKIENWSDFEVSLGKIIKSNNLGHKYNKEESQNLYKSLSEVQKLFLEFINDVVSTDVILALNKDAQKMKWAKKTFSMPFNDLDREDHLKLNFTKSEEWNHHCNLKYRIINFNYTPLLENYIYLDRMQHEQKPSTNTENNFELSVNTKGYDKARRWFTQKDHLKLNVEFYQPHGKQSIPRSLLFGVDETGYEKNNNLKPFYKPYWAKNDILYREYIEKTELFYIFGSSQGVTDQWWWGEIIKCLDKRNADLIIYKYIFQGTKKKSKVDKAAMKKKVIDDFLEIFNNVENKEVSNIIENKRESIINRIAVVIYSDSKEISFLGLSKLE